MFRLIVVFMQICSSLKGTRNMSRYAGDKYWITLCFLFLVCIPVHLGAQELVTDPQGSGVIIGAVRWLQGTLLGTVATVVSVIAVASVGLLMLTGRINWRFGAIVILGCFIVFGAASIVAGIQATASVSAGS
jgi:type IV secretion system protein VirB2